MFRKLSFRRDRNHRSHSDRKHSRRGSSLRTAILGVERLELREMLAVDTGLLIPADQFFGVGESAPFRATFDAAVEADNTVEEFDCFIDWGDGSGEEQVTALSLEKTPFNVDENAEGNPIVGRIEGLHAYSTQGLKTITIKLVDGFGNETIDTADVMVYPTLSGLGISGSSDEFFEGNTWSLSLNHNPTDVVESWNINWGEGAIEGFSNDNAAEHFYADDDLFTLASVFWVSATAKVGGDTYYAGSMDKVVSDVPMNPSISGATTVNQGTEFVLTLSNEDVPADPVISWLIFWGDGVPEEIDGSQITASHTYNLPGDYSIFAIAKNDDYHEKNTLDNEPPNFVPLTVVGQTSGTSLVDGTLFITGSTTGTGNDTAVISLSGGDISVDASVNGTNPFLAPISSVNAIVIDLGTGNDILVALPNMNIPMTINGGEGNDLITSGGGDDLIDGGPGVDIVFASGGDDVVLGGVGNDGLFGGNGDDVLIGGDGNDVLSGDAGRDLLIGSDDEDLLSSGNGEDILIGGSTAWDGYDDLNSQANIDNIMAIWTGSGSFTTRRDNLLASTSLQPNVLFDDDATDLILGGAGRDLIFGDDVLDIILMSGLDTLIEVT